MILFADHPRAGLGLESTVNLWVRPGSGGWEDGIKQTNLDLALLVAHVLRINWQAELNFIAVVPDEDMVEEQRTRLADLMQLSRIRGTALVTVGEFPEALDDHAADLNIFGMAPMLDYDECRRLMLAGRASAVFVRGSGRENAPHETRAEVTGCVSPAATPRM